MRSSDTPTPFRLSPFRPEHAEAVVGWVHGVDELRLLAPSTSHPLTPEKVLGWLTPTSSAFLVTAEQGRIPVAYGELNPASRASGRFWLGHVIVRPELRRKGVGKRLVHALAQEAFLRRNASGLELIVFPENETAIRCYRTAGFRLIGTETHMFQPDQPPERMLRLELTKTRFLSRLEIHGDAAAASELSGSTAIAAKTPVTNPSRICDTPF